MSRRRCKVEGCQGYQGKTPMFHLPKDINIRNQWLVFMYSKIPEDLSKEVMVCAAHFTADCFVNLAQYNAGFSKKLVIKNSAVPTLLGPTSDPQPLCHKIVDGLCGREPPRLVDYGDRWSLGEWLELIDSLSLLFRKATGDDRSEEEVLAGLADVGSGYGEAVLTVLKARREEIRLGLLERTHLTSSSTLQDFDWQLKLALSSDKISSLQTPLLNLNLYVRENGALRPVAIEMSREELHTVIASLEAANKVVLQLK